jgi:hypothetical protein
MLASLTIIGLIFRIPNHTESETKFLTKSWEFLFCGMIFILFIFNSYKETLKTHTFEFVALLPIAFNIILVLSYIFLLKVKNSTRYTILTILCTMTNIISAIYIYLNKSNYEILTSAIGVLLTVTILRLVYIVNSKKSE